MKKKFTNFLILLMVVSMQIAMAQEVTIRGTVTDDTGMALPGVSVIVRGTVTGTQTDAEGKYSIRVGVGQELQFSFVGMTTVQRVVTADATVIDVTLELDATSLEEVLVVAYGDQEKKAIVGSVASLNSETLEKQQLTTVTQALQGTVPGVIISNAGGQPGSEPTIRIRGISSVNASASPLIVVDGVQYNGSLTNISADQIESMNVLKDASSTALYGSRGSNGVIIITTKRGKFNSAPTITLNSVTGVSTPAVPLHKRVGTEDLFRYTWESLRNTDMYVNGNAAVDAGYNAANNLIPTLGYNPYSVPNPIFENGAMNPSRQLLWETDWEDLILRNQTLRQEHSASVYGGSEKTTYFFSGNYLKQQGNVKTAELERISTRLNVTTHVNDWLEVGMNNSLSLRESLAPSQDGFGYFGSTQNIYQMSPIYPVHRRDEQGNLILDDEGNPIYDFGIGSGLVNAIRPVLGGDNVVAAFDNYQVRMNATNFTTNGYLNINFLNDFSFRTSLAYENFLTNNYDYASPEYGYAAANGGFISQSRNVFTTLNFVNKLSYGKTFGAHGVTADLIYEAYQGKSDSFSGSGQGFLPGVKVIGGRTVITDVGGGIDEERLLSYMARVSYNYRERYFIEASYRKDGSTRFSDDVRWGDFFSVGGSWLVSEESFLDGVGPVNYLKLKASYGELGNNRLGSYFPYLQLFNSGWNEGNLTGVVVGGTSDPRLRWEKTASLNVGAEFGLFNDRITGLVEYYNKESIDLIFGKPVAPSTGDRTITTNIGSLRNYGLEVTLNGSVMERQNFKWVSGINFSLDKNKFTELPEEELVRGNKKYTVGSSIYDFYIQEWAGVDPADGYGMWYMEVRDGDGNPTGERTTTKNYSDADRYYVGSALPKVIGGFHTDLTYGNFDFNVLFSFSFGSKLYDSDYAGLMNTVSVGENLHPDIAGRWQQPGDITDIPMLATQLPIPNANGTYTTRNVSFASQSTRFLFDNDWVRLRAVTIGYTLPRNLTDKFQVRSLRVFLRGDNLLTFSSLKGGDPEQGLAGNTDVRSSILRTGSVGVNIQF